MVCSHRCSAEEGTSASLLPETAEEVWNEPQQSSDPSTPSFFFPDGQRASCFKQKSTHKSNKILKKIYFFQDIYIYIFFFLYIYIYIYILKKHIFFKSYNLILMFVDELSVLVNIL